MLTYMYDLGDLADVSVYCEIVSCDTFCQNHNPIGLTGP